MLHPSLARRIVNFLFGIVHRMELLWIHCSAHFRQSERMRRIPISLSLGTLLANFHLRINWCCRQAPYLHCISYPSVIPFSWVWMKVSYSLASNILFHFLSSIFHWIVSKSPGPLQCEKIEKVKFEFVTKCIRYWKFCKWITETTQRKKSAYKL